MKKVIIMANNENKQYRNRDELSVILHHENNKRCDNCIEMINKSIPWHDIPCRDCKYYPSNIDKNKGDDKWRPIIFCGYGGW